MNRIITVLSLLWLSMSAMADEGFSFSYATQDASPALWGTGKAETYDVAIRINASSFTGKKVKGIRTFFPASSGVSNIKAWASSSLQLTTVDGKKTNNPDLASTEGKVSDGILEAYFAEPVTIPAEGIYVGYSLTVDSLYDYTKIPVAVCGNVTNDDGFYIHTSRTYLKWTSRSAELQCVLFMSVIMEGDFNEDILAIVRMDDAHCKTGDTAYVKTRVRTMGSRPVESVTYNYQAGDSTGTATYTLPEPIPAVYGQEKTLTLPLRVFNSKGTVPLSLDITHVNGKANSLAGQMATSTLGVYPFIPVHRPLCEEFSGLWCGYCTGGFAMLKEMSQRYPDDFIAISFHAADILQSIPIDKFPYEVPYYPYLCVDRRLVTNAYFGENPGSDLGFEQTWQLERERFVPADISVSAHFDDNHPEMVRISTTVTSAVDSTEANFRIGYMLLANDLQGDTRDWYQINSYSGNQKYAGLTGLDYFVNSPEAILDLHHDHVIVAASDFDGVEGSLPLSLAEEASYSHDYSFNTNEALCVYMDSIGRPIIQDMGNLTVVAYIVDANNVIVNAAKVHVGGCDTAIKNVTTNASGETGAVLYNLQGRQLSDAPRQGIYIMRYRDGRTVKINRH